MSPPHSLQTLPEITQAMFKGTIPTQAFKIVAVVMVYSRLACTFLLFEGAELTLKLLLASLDDLIWEKVTSHMECHSESHKTASGITYLQHFSIQ